MANQTLQTTNFTINFDPAALPNSPKRADALRRVCESEFTVLTGWFGVTSGFGTGNRISIYLAASFPSGGVADNAGYHSDGSTKIDITAQDTNPDDAQAAGVVLQAFVAELVEILMSYRNKQGPETWNAGYSHGEGLSQFCAQRRFLSGYKAYASQNPVFNQWLQLADRNGPAHDWITTPEKKDTNFESLGCSLLFLLYLHTQLGHSEADIIQQGGNTLALTYQNLTGRTDALAAFRALLDAYFPPGNTPALQSFDPFPLLTGTRRRVEVDAQSVPLRLPSIASSGDVVISPGFLCPKKKYHYDLLSTPQRLTCTAMAYGFGQPLYRWRVNGLDVPASGTITPTATVWMDDPTQQPSLRKTVLEPVAINCAVTAFPFSSALVMDFASTVGHIELTVEAFAHEKYASADETSGIDWLTIGNELLDWEQAYDDDRAQCEARWRDLVRRYVRFDPFFNILQTLPDPPDDYRRVLVQIEALSQAVRRLEGHSPKDAQQVESAIEQAIGINATVLHDIGRLGHLTPSGHQGQG